MSLVNDVLHHTNVAADMVLYNVAVSIYSSCEIGENWCRNWWEI